MRRTGPRCAVRCCYVASFAESEKRGVDQRDLRPARERVRAGGDVGVSAVGEAGGWCGYVSGLTLFVCRLLCKPSVVVVPAMLAVNRVCLLANRSPSRQKPHTTARMLTVGLRRGSRLERRGLDRRSNAPAGNKCRGLGRGVVAAAVHRGRCGLLLSVGNSSGRPG